MARQRVLLELRLNHAIQPVEAQPKISRTAANKHPRGPRQPPHRKAPVSSRNQTTGEPTGARTLSPAPSSITTSPPARPKTGTSSRPLPEPPIGGISRARFNHVAKVAT